MLTPEEVEELYGSPDAVADSWQRITDRSQHRSFKVEPIPPAYADRLFRPETARKNVNAGAALDDFLGERFKAPPPVPEAVTYEVAKSVYWNCYREIVIRETKAEPRRPNKENPTAQDEKEMRFFQAITRWFIGLPGELDPNLSLYLWADLGVGKSTAAEAGALMMDYFTRFYSYTDRRFNGILSLDEAFLALKTKQDLSAFDKVSRGAWVLDELSERHIEYRHYGNNLNIAGDLLTARHNLWKRAGTHTVITTNIPPTFLQKVLQSERLLARMNQQYNFVKMPGSDKRAKP